MVIFAAVRERICKTPRCQTPCPTPQSVVHKTSTHHYIYFHNNHYFHYHFHHNYYHFHYNNYYPCS
jgi:hypothetical protein